MRKAGTVFSLLALFLLPYIAQSQSLGDADNIILRLRPVCNGGPGGGLIIAFDIKPRTLGLNSTIGAYTVVLGYTTVKINYLGTSRRYETGYWAGFWQNDQIGSGPGGRFNSQNAGQAMPLVEDYFEPSTDCSNNKLNDGFWEILRYTFSISSGANGTVDILFGALAGYRQAGPYQTQNYVTAVYYGNPVNNGNDSALVLQGLIVPVELTSFTSVALPDGAVELNWVTASETNNHGFEVQRNTGDGWEAIGFVEGKGTVTYATDYTYTDSDVRNVPVANNVVLYRLRQVDNDGAESLTQISAVNLIPQSVGLQDVYPNPVFVGGQATLSYTLAVPGTVDLAVYNSLGERVATLVEREALATGGYQAIWNGTNHLGAQLPAGTYFVRFSADLGNSQVIRQTRQVQIIR